MALQDSELPNVSTGERETERTGIALWVGASK
jgi:hypothetical protein